MAAAEYAPPTTTAQQPQWFAVGPATSFERSGSRAHFEVKGRFVSVINHRGSLFGMDAVCFHAGGPLTLGEIEDVAGTPCVKCPWHQYLICLDSGDKLYDSMTLNPSTGKLIPGGWKAMPRLQRPHKVAVGSDGQVYVLIDSDPTEKLRSDGYAYDKRTAAAAFGGKITAVHVEPVPHPP